MGFLNATDSICAIIYIGQPCIKSQKRLTKFYFTSSIENDCQYQVIKEVGGEVMLAFILEMIRGKVPSDAVQDLSRKTGDLSVLEPGETASVSRLRGDLGGFLSPRDNLIRSRLVRMGFMDGEPIKLLNRAPLFQEPILVEIKGAQIALSRREGSFVLVDRVSSQ